MNIGIIGAGDVGQALARASSRAGHAVTMSATDTDELQRITGELGVAAAASNTDAVAEADVVILAVPFEAIPDIATELGSRLDGTLVIDVTNRFAPEQLDGSSNAEKIQDMLPAVGVVKAFNTIFASRQDDPTIDGIELDGFVAGDDDASKARALEFVSSLGFRPIDAGPLAMARALEGMAILNISLNMTNDWPWQTGWKLLGPTG